MDRSAPIFASRPATAEDALVPARAQLATQPARFPTSYNAPEGDAAAMSAETFDIAPHIRDAILGLFAPPAAAAQKAAR